MKNRVRKETFIIKDFEDRSEKLEFGPKKQPLQLRKNGDTIEFGYIGIHHHASMDTEFDCKIRSFDLLVTVLSQEPSSDDILIRGKNGTSLRVPDFRDPQRGFVKGGRMLLSISYGFNIQHDGDVRRLDNPDLIHLEMDARVYSLNRSVVEENPGSRLAKYAAKKTENNFELIKMEESVKGFEDLVDYLNGEVSLKQFGFEKAKIVFEAAKKLRLEQPAQQCLDFVFKDEPFHSVEFVHWDRMGEVLFNSDVPAEVYHLDQVKDEELVKLPKANADPRKVRVLVLVFAVSLRGAWFPYLYRDFYSRLEEIKKNGGLLRTQ